MMIYFMLSLMLLGAWVFCGLLAIGIILVVAFARYTFGLQDYFYICEDDQDRADILMLIVLGPISIGMAFLAMYIEMVHPHLMRLIKGERL